MTIDSRVAGLIRDGAFAAFTTLAPGGHPTTQMMWVDHDDEHILINTEIGRAKYRHVQDDPRVVVLIPDPADPYRYAEIRGRVVDEVAGRTARDHIDVLSERYFGRPYKADQIESERVLLRIRPLRAVGER
jgi:PPOX class probable F420-dependent enzyme